MVAGATHARVKKPLWIVVAGDVMGYELAAAVSLHVPQVVNCTRNVFPQIGLGSVPSGFHELGVENRCNRSSPFRFPIRGAGQPATETRKSAEYLACRYCFVPGHQCRDLVESKILAYAQNDHAMTRLRNPVVLALDYKIAWLAVWMAVGIIGRWLQKDRMQGVPCPAPLCPSDYLRRMPEIIQHLLENFAPLYFRRE
jgi:hypothetical protein